MHQKKRIMTSSFRTLFPAMMKWHFFFFINLIWVDILWFKKMFAVLCGTMSESMTSQKLSRTVHMCYLPKIFRCIVLCGTIFVQATYLFISFVIFIHSLHMIFFFIICFCLIVIQVGIQSLFNLGRYLYLFVNKNVNVKLDNKLELITGTIYRHCLVINVRCR